MKKQKIQAIGKDGVIKGEKIVLNAIGSEQYITLNIMIIMKKKI